MEYIPKIIHYCWFGRKPLPKQARKCIASWKKFFPDYEIKEWNEDNFDVNSVIYTRQAYKIGKYAFVSDYARFKIIYEEGGIYFDTDVEVIKSFDDILTTGPFMGCEAEAKEGCPPKTLNVNPGLGIGAPKGLEFYKAMLDFYENRHFIDETGNIIGGTIVTFTSDMLQKYGLKNEPNVQQVKSINIYPPQYFNPFNDLTGKLKITPKSHSIHWYSKSWIKTSKTRVFLSRTLHRIFGTKTIHNLCVSLRSKS